MSRTERKRNLIGGFLLALAIVLLGTLIFQNFQSLTERDTAQSSAATAVQQKKNLAEEVADACESGQVVKSSAGVDLCARAATIAQQPEASEGPAGPRGLPGINGVDGKDGAAGTAGKAATDGKDGGTGPVGPPGPAGLNGAPGIPGAAGAPGATGPVGETGMAGKGVTKVECVGEGNASYWLITYTDGTTNQSTGPCRITQPDPTP